MKTENKCFDLKPEQLKLLKKGDKLKQIFEEQIALQERLGTMALYRKTNLKGKVEYVKDNIIHLGMELAEMLERLPFKHWKKYSKEFEKDWESDEQRVETIFEYIDALHFFLNIGIILGFSVEEVYYYYMSKNRENFERQNRGY